MDEYRKRFVRLVDYQDREVEDLTDETVRKVNSLVKKSGSDEYRILSGINPIIAVWTVSMLALLLKNNTTTAEIVGEQQVSIIDKKYDNPILTRMAQTGGDKYTNFVTVNFLNRKFITDGVSVGQRIKNVADSTRKTAINIVSLGIDEGKAAKDIAKDLENFVKSDPTERWIGPFQWYRDKFGYKVKKIPIGIKAGSLHSNAIRIARTEINTTYRIGTIEINKNRPWVAGWVWNLSGAHPAIDICDDWADASPYKDPLEIEGLGHPHCMCYITTVLKDEVN